MSTSTPSRGDFISSAIVVGLATALGLYLGVVKTESNKKLDEYLNRPKVTEVCLGGILHFLTRYPWTNGNVTRAETGEGSSVSCENQASTTPHQL